MNSETRAIIYGLTSALLVVLGAFSFSSANETPEYAKAVGELGAALAALMATVKTVSQRPEETKAASAPENDGKAKAGATIDLGDMLDILEPRQREGNDSFLA